MKDNQVMFYNTSIQEVMEILQMENRRTPAFIDLDEYQVRLNKKGPDTLITLLEGLSGTEPIDGIIDLKIGFPGKYRDMESIKRIEAIVALNPNNNWWKEILKELHEGEPLHYRVEEILVETEERIASPDAEALDLVNKALRINPRNRFVQSIQRQLLSGRELSDKQLNAIRNIVQPTSQPQVNLRGDANYNMILEALKIEPRNSFLLSLGDTMNEGRTLSPRQTEALIRVHTSLTLPANRLLRDLKENAHLQSDDWDIVVKGLRSGVDSLTEEDRKRIRHLIYRNQRRLDNKYDKEEVRNLLKKGSVGRQASEIIYDLEMRIARLEARRRG